MNSSTYIASGSAANPTHAGVERVASSIGALANNLTRLGARKTVGSSLIAVGTMAAITAAERAMDAAPTGFTAELIALGIVATLAYFTSRAIVIPALRAIARAWRTLEAYEIHSQEERHFLELSQRDPRLMSDLLAIKSRDSQHADALALREADIGARDKLVNVAPWVTLARFH